MNMYTVILISILVGGFAGIVEGIYKHNKDAPVQTQRMQQK